MKKDSQWVINPPVDFVSNATTYGRFLAEDYRMLIQHLYVPETFTPYEGLTNRRFVIIGGKDNPILLAKSLFLCIKLAGAESIAIKLDNLDDTFIAKNILENHSKTLNYKIFTPHYDNLHIDVEFLESINDSTDIVVFGDEKKVEAFRKYETVDRRVWEYGDRFSFGVIKSNAITQSIINDICFDFFSYYGEGRLAPRFYFIIGKISKKMIQNFSNNMIAMYRPMIEQYRDKLPLTSKSKLVDLFIKSHYEAPYVRVDEIGSKNIFDKLYGDVRLIQVKNVEEVKSFIEEWKDKISSVAVNLDDDWKLLDMLEDVQVNRICSVGDMQFPDFFEQYDIIDDFQIYVSEDDRDNYF